MLSHYAEPRYGHDLFAAGAEGRAYLLKDRVSDGRQLQAAIEVVARGGSMIDPEMVRLLLESEERQHDSPLTELTPREREVLAAMAAGKSNAAIAEELVLTKRAVEKHVGRDLPQARAAERGRREPPRRRGAALPVRRRRRTACTPTGGGVLTPPADACPRHCPRMSAAASVVGDGWIEHTGRQEQRGSSDPGAHGRRPAAVPRRGARGDQRDARASRRSRR